MNISKKRILELQKIFKEEYNKKLSFTETKEAAYNLIGFFDLLFKIDKRNKNELKGSKDNK